MNVSDTKRSIEKFRQATPHAQVAVIEYGHHYCFIQNEEEVYATMRAFVA